MVGITGLIGRADLAASILLTGFDAVIIGSVTLHRYEVPEAVRYGGAQQMRVHRFPGGARIIDTMGRDDAEISWSGICLGADAVYRAQELDAMRVAGNAVPLSWGDHDFSVVISRLELEERFQRVNYQITCTVVADLSAAVSFPIIGAAAQIALDLASSATALAGVISPNLVGAGPSSKASASMATAAPAAAANVATAQSATVTASANDFQLGSASAQAANTALAASAASLGAIEALGVAGAAAVRQAAPVGQLSGTASDVGAMIVLAGDMAAVRLAAAYTARAQVNGILGTV